MKTFLFLIPALILMVSCDRSLENNRSAGGGTGMDKEMQRERLNSFPMEEQDEGEPEIPEAYRNEDNDIEVNEEAP